MTELETIEKHSGMKENSCSCSKCVAMCKKFPCIGTPSDILAIVKAGYVDKLREVIWTVGTKYGIEPIEMVQIKTAEDKSCIFLKDDLCSLHDAGLKPTEGKVADHNVEEMEFPLVPPSFLVAATWKLKKNEAIIWDILTSVWKHEIETSEFFKKLKQPTCG